MIDCIFCKIVKKEIPADIVYEDENCLAFLDINPANSGHVQVIPKEHCENLYTFPDQTLSSIMPVVKKLALAIKNGVNADGINIIMNNEQAAGQVIPHAHIHIIPRFKNDGHKDWIAKKYEDGQSKIVAEKIRATLH